MLILIENQEKNTGIQKNINNADQKGKVNEHMHHSHRALDLTPAKDLDLFRRGQVTLPQCQSEMNWQIPHSVHP